MTEELTKAPAMPFYGKQFYDDEAVWLSTLAHQGLYVALLWNQWQEGSIPADLRMIARLVGQPEKDVRRLWPVVGRHFITSGNDDGRLFNPALEKIREKAAKLRERRSAAGSKGGSTRVANVQAKAQAKDVPPNGYVTATAEAFDSDSEFEILWRAYPRKLGKHEAQRHFRAQVESRSDLAAITSALKNYAAENKILEREDEFLLHGSTFFNNRWRDYVDGVWIAPRKKLGKGEAFVVPHRRTVSEMEELFGRKS